MIYVFKDESGYQQFPEPGPGAPPYLEVSGEAEQRILNGESYRITGNGQSVEFLAVSEIEAQRLNQAKQAKREQIDAWRQQAETAGFPYTFPDGSTGIVQIRNSDDKANITGLVVAAQSNPGAMLEFRDGGDISHDMTSEQVISMGTAVQAFISSNYQRGWALKDQVDGAATLADVEAITWE